MKSGRCTSTNQKLDTYKYELLLCRCVHAASVELGLLPNTICQYHFRKLDNWSSPLIDAHHPQARSVFYVFRPMRDHVDLENKALEMVTISSNWNRLLLHIVPVWVRPGRKRRAAWAGHPRRWQGSWRSGWRPTVLVSRVYRSVGRIYHHATQGIVPGLF